MPITDLYVVCSGEAAFFHSYEAGENGWQAGHVKGHQKLFKLFKKYYIKHEVHTSINMINRYIHNKNTLAKKHREEDFRKFSKLNKKHEKSMIKGNMAVL